jgi:hypothetical protein
VSVVLLISEGQLSEIVGNRNGRMIEIKFSRQFSLRVSAKDAKADRRKNQIIPRTMRLNYKNITDIGIFNRQRVN